MKQSKQLKTKWYLNYLHTFGYYCDLRKLNLSASESFARMKNFARSQPEFTKSYKDELITNMFWNLRKKFGRPNLAPEHIREYYNRKYHNI